MIGKKEIENVQNIYYYIFSSLNKVLIGQEDVKKVVTASLLSDINSKMLFMGGKTQFNQIFSK